MTTQYLRQVSLIVADGERGLDLSSLRIRFQVKQSDLQTPNNATIRIWNLSEATAAAVKKEFKRVILQAGYQGGALGTIFDGTIIQAKSGRENATDTYLDIIAADGDEAYNFAVVSTSIAAGSTPSDRAKAAIGAMGDHGVTAGYIADLPGQPLPRGVAMFGMAKDHLRTIAAGSDAKWSIQNGQATMMQLTKPLPGAAVVLNAGSGLIGIPEQTQDGIRIRCLLNADIKVGGVVQVNNAAINLAPLAVSLSGQIQNSFLPRVTEDGFYRVIVAEHAGDTRGQEFYTDTICIALSDGLTPGLVNKGYS